MGNLPVHPFSLNQRAARALQVPVVAPDQVCPGRLAFDARNPIPLAVFRESSEMLELSGSFCVGLATTVWAALLGPGWGSWSSVPLSTEGGKEDSDSSSGKYSEPLSVGWSRSSRGRIGDLAESPTPVIWDGTAHRWAQDPCPGREEWSRVGKKRWEWSRRS